MSKRAKPRPERANGKGKPAAPKPSGKLPAQTPVVVWPTPAPPPPGPAPEAVSQYEGGIAAFQKQNYNEAAELFRRLLAEFPREGSLADRARVYLGICERALAARPTGPQTAEERLTAATAALNDGDLTRADELARAVLSPSGGWLVAPATWINRTITVGLLPSQVRERYGMTWTPRQDRIVARLLSVLRVTRRLLPDAIALWPDARR